MGELGIGHVEPELARRWHIALAADELEAHLGIDETADQPSASDTVDMYAAPRDPDTVRKVGGRKRYRLACTPDIGMGIALLVQLAQRRLGALPTMPAAEAEPDDPGPPPLALGAFGAGRWPRWIGRASRRV